MENGTQMILEKYMPKASQTQTAGASDFHVRTSALQENKQDLKEIAQASFTELCTFLGKCQKKKNPMSCSLRMLKICLVLMEDGISPNFSLNWTGGGTMQSGKFSILRISECHRAERGVSLLDIVEDEVPQKYFLTAAQMEKIIL